MFFVVQDIDPVSTATDHTHARARHSPNVLQDGGCTTLSPRAQDPAQVSDISGGSRGVSTVSPLN